MTPPRLVDEEFRQEYERAHRVGGNLPGGGGGNTIDEGRINKLELAVATITGNLDWAKIVASTIIAVVIAGFALLAGLVYNYGSRSDAQSAALGTKIDGLAAKLNDEFRAQRAEQSYQVQTLATAITAAKQQPPQVLLVPTPQAFPAK